MEYAPVILFVYNRPSETKQTLDALKRNILSKETDLYIFSDAPKSPENIKQVEAVRAIINNINGFKKIFIYKQKKNKGLAQSIIDGVTTVIRKRKRAIILEDDLITSPNFLNFMNNCLTEFENNKTIMHIAGYSDPVKNITLPPLFFWRVVSTWGWATWEDRWAKFIDDPVYLYEKLIQSKQIENFDLNSYGFFIDQLLRNISGGKKTWGIKWQASIYLNNGLCVNPGKTLIQNIGFGNRASNTKYLNKAIANQRLENNVLPDLTKFTIKETEQIAIKFRNYYRARTISDPLLGFYLTVKSFIKYKLRNIFL